MTVSLAQEQWQSWNAQGTQVLKAWRVGARDPKTGVVRTLAIINRELPGDEQVAAATLMAAVPELIDSMRYLLSEVEGLLVEYNELRCINGDDDEPESACVAVARKLLTRLTKLEGK